MSSEIFASFLAAALLFSVVLGILTSSRQRWELRWRILPVACLAELAVLTLGVAAAGGSVGSAIVVGIVVVAAELVGVAVLGKFLPVLEP